MLLKRIYDKPPGWEPKRNVKDEEGNLPDPEKPEGVVLNPPPLDHIEIKHTGIHPEQNFSTQMVSAGISQGWITLGKGQLIIHTMPEDLVYAIDVAPGRYCCHCSEKLPDDVDGALSRAHVKTAHPDTPSPDFESPSGYCKVNAYLCTLKAALHDKYHFTAPARSPKKQQPKIDLRAMRRKDNG